MHETPHPDAWLSDSLEALASPVRLRLLRLLRTPRALREIELKADVEADASPRGTLARQSVRRHLDRLCELRIVEAREAERDYGATREYVVNHRTLYALAEEFRGLARLRPVVEIADETARGGASDPSADPAGPCLVVVKGLEEGLTFDLRGGRTRWVVGRRRDVDVSLDFDPYVSAENAILWREGETFWAEDLPGSRNGTSVNFRRLAAGERRRLRHGDVLGVGCTRLVHWI